MVANKQNLRVPTSEEARENGKKGGIASGKARKEKKLLADVLRDILNEKAPNQELTKMEAIIQRVVNETYKKGDVYKLEKLQKILGEAKQTLEVKMPQITVKSDEDAKLIAELMEGDN